MGGDDGFAVPNTDQLDGAAAEDLVEQVRADTWPEGEFCSEFTCGAVGLIEVNEHGGVDPRTSTLAISIPIEGVHRDHHQRVGLELIAGVIVAAWLFAQLIGSSRDGLINDGALNSWQLEVPRPAGVVQGGLDREVPIGEGLLFILAGDTPVLMCQPVDRGQI